MMLFSVLRIGSHGILPRFRSDAGIQPFYLLKIPVGLSMYQIGIISATFHPRRDRASPWVTPSIRSGRHRFPYQPHRFLREAGHTPHPPVTLPPPSNRSPDGVLTVPRAPSNWPRAPTRIPWDAHPFPRAAVPASGMTVHPHGKRGSSAGKTPFSHGWPPPHLGRHPLPPGSRPRAWEPHSARREPRFAPRDRSRRACRIPFFPRENPILPRRIGKITGRGGGFRVFGFVWIMALA